MIIASVFTDGRETRSPDEYDDLRSDFLARPGNAAREGGVMNDCDDAEAERVLVGDAKPPRVEASVGHGAAGGEPAGVTSLYGGSNEEMPTREDDGTALAKLRHLIRTRTRFGAADVRVVSETVVAQSLTVSVAHSLTAELKIEHINGITAPHGSETERCEHARTSALAEHPQRLALALRQLDQQLLDPLTAYDAINDGLWLPQTVTYYDLDSCSPCSGNGRVTCYACNGARQQTCSLCRGVGRVICDRCYSNGKLNCPHCHGTMSVDASGTEHYTAWVWVNDHYETQYASRWVTKSAPCRRCFYGKVNCTNCSGIGQVNCTTCMASGKIRCQTCAGVGNLTCDPCAGSGHVGIASWVEVHHKAEYTMAWDSPLDSRATEIEAKVGLHQIAQESRAITLTTVDRNHSALSLVQVDYTGTLDVMHLNAICNQEHYHVVAFGTNRQWHDLNGIIGDLLSSDLDALRSAMITSGWRRVFGEKLNNLATPLRHVVDSGLNIELVDATLYGKPVDELHTVLSVEYADKLQTALLSALKRIYTCMGLRTWWPAPLVLGLVAGALWWFSHPNLGAFVAVLSLPVSLFHLLWQSKALFSKFLGDKAKAMQAIGLIKAARHHRLAHVLHFVSWGLVTGLAAFGVAHPHSTVVAVATTTAAATATNAQPPVAISSAPAASLAQAKALVKERRFAKARPLLKALAESGEKNAFLPLAKVLALDDRGHSQNVTQIDRVAAAMWALKAAKTFPDDAEALFVAGDLAVSDWRKPTDMATGIPLLKRAAAKDRADAMHSLGLIYANGFHVPKNMTKARHWFTQAANAGQAGDIYIVGLMDWIGDGLRTPNRTRARERWRKAAALGDERAKKAIAIGHPPLR